MILRTLIVDDEPLARERLRTLLGQEPDIQIVGEVADGCSAVRVCTECEVDLLFLDVQMPELDGFEVVEALGKLVRSGELVTLPVVAFVTAYDEYALRAFEVHALDYLLKPFDRKRFERALVRMREQIERERAKALNKKLIALVADAQVRKKYLQRLMVRSRGRIVFIDASEVDWIEAAGNYVALHVSGKQHLVRDTMSGLESRLDPKRFRRAHRSIIVQLDRVRELRPKSSGDYDLILQDGTHLALSRTYHRGLKRRLAGIPLQGSLA